MTLEKACVMALHVGLKTTEEAVCLVETHAINIFRDTEMRGELIELNDDFSRVGNADIKEIFPNIRNTGEHGHWIEEKLSCYRCDLCNESVFTQKEVCPGCGADMFVV